MIQIRITIDHGKAGEPNAGLQLYVIEAQSKAVPKHRMVAIYPDHAELVAETLKAGAILAGVKAEDIAIFYPKNWKNVLNAFRHEGG